ncbi:aminotransferase class V-fold PLP-dependent enzyme [Bradyrhizobium sp. LTSP885]|uniref:aminotransferase class V-fold PLP-dependent enzyme n=1 Tax=Bradyrhizobium sp. LTSP885 TaxID=1619232 RepID=UPI000A5A9960|nr:aminotransferase class V-fold PLP-dependent enzyme [Bradyrhizobium sp. LTSP885]
MTKATAEFSPAARNDNPYLALGVRPYINCASVRTAHGGSVMLPEVRAAIAQASRQFVSLDELMEGASRRIAELTGAELGIVTCGSSAALTLATAACVAGNDPVKMLRLPFTDGWTNRVIMLKSHRYAYDQAIRIVGTHIVEVETIADLDAALTQPVAMIAVLGSREATSPVRLEEFVARAAPRGVPVLVDAASDHIERPSPYLVRGADMVVYSGGKFLRGPQTSGLLLGRKDLIQAAWWNASPHQAFARGMKVSKEDVIGVLTALEVWLERRDPAAELRRWNEDLAIVAHRLELPGVKTNIVAPQGAVHVPRLTVSWDLAQIALHGEALRLRLLESEPRIMIDDKSVTDNSVQIDPFGLQPGEADQVGLGIKAILSEPVVAAKPAHSTSNADVSGLWNLVIKFLSGERSHRLKLRQHSGSLTGSQQSHQFEGDVVGEIKGDTIHLVFRMRHEGTVIVYSLDGSVADGVMHGKVTLGSAPHQHQGPINLAQFGSGSFQGVRNGEA